MTKSLEGSWTLRSSIVLHPSHFNCRFKVVSGSQGNDWLISMVKQELKLPYYF